jgi:hypothetical protein
MGSLSQTPYSTCPESVSALTENTGVCRVINKRKEMTACGHLLGVSDIVVCEAAGFC